MDYIKLFQEPDGSIQKTNEYIIQSGDSLTSIAKELKIPINQLIQANKLENPDSIQAGQKLVIPIFRDREIAATEDYGKGYGKRDKERLQTAINPLLGIGFDEYVNQASRYLFYEPYDVEPYLSEEPQPNADDIALWERHIGFPRDTEQMPLTNIRFMGDYEEDGSPKFPNAEYTGVSQETKDGIRNAIESGVLKMDTTRNWTQVYDDNSKRRNKRNNVNPEYEGYYQNTTHLGNYGIRENGNSGIYDIFDTYDFKGHLFIPDRENGHQIEVRDTIHGPNAQPQLYNPLYTKSNEKKK